jgi:hypothetical protein
MFWRDAGFQQVIQGRGEGGRGGAVRFVFPEGFGDEAGGAFGLPVGELVRPRVPLFGHSQPALVGGGQGGQRRVHFGQVRGPAVGQGEHHAQD